MSKNCTSCKFLFTVADGVAIGQKNHFCRRNPPTPFAVPLQSPQGLQIMLRATHAPLGADVTSEWCGEHQEATPALQIVK